MTSPVLVTALVVVALALGLALRLLGKRSEAAVLSFVGAQRGPVPTLEVFRALGGFWVYPALRRLERAGKLRSWEAPGGPERAGAARRLYALAGWKGDIAFVPIDRPVTRGEPVYIASPEARVSYVAVEGEALAALRERTCPYCHTPGLEDGPRGGLSVNVTCRVCGARFNLHGPHAEAGAQLLNGPTRTAKA
jgi:hypothetical protein